MKKVRVALIGAGAMANAMHYPSLASFDDVELVGLCDLDPQKLKQTAARFKIGRAFSDYRQMLAETEPQAVYVLMPPHILFEVAMDVLERGHHLFIEKPPGITTFQTDSMARLAASQNLITGVGFQRRYHPMLHACWEAVQEKGEIHQVVASFYKNQPPQAVHPYYRGAIDILHCDAIHVVDALRYYSGLAEVKGVTSEVRTLDCWYAVSFSALVYFANGAVGTLLANWRTGKRALKFEFHAYDASAFADADGQAEVWKDSQLDFRTTCTEYANSSQPHIVQGFLAENRAFIEAIKTGQPLHNSLQDAVKTMQLADMIYEKAITRSNEPDI